MPNLRKKFSKIYDQNIDKIYRYIYLRVGSKETAEDLCSEAFSRAWTFFHAQEAKIENPRAFLYQVARNLIADHYRKNSKYQIVTAENIQMSDPDTDIEKDILVRSDIEKIKQVLSYLKEDYQDVIVWHYLDELSIKEVAEMMEKSEQAVRVTLHRALKALRKEMKKK